MGAEFLQNLEVSLSEAEKETILGSIGQQAHYMSILLDGLLDITQIEAGTLNLDLKPIDLSQFLSEAVKHQTMIATPKGTQVRLEPTPASEVMADPVRLRQVIDNLISNAVKYSPPGSTVRINVQRSPSGWRINVQDEGPGITEKDRKRLFQDFSRLSARPTGSEKSVGLGLAISRNVVKAHGGQIGVDSEPGQGATFWFTLPD
jgi:signal transduction histidine kinase